MNWVDKCAHNIQNAVRTLNIMQIPVNYNWKHPNQELSGAKSELPGAYVHFIGGAANYPIICP